MPSPITIREIVYNEAGLSYNVPAHAHNLFQWYCVVYGKVETSIAGKRYQLGPQDSVLIPPSWQRSPHCLEKPPGYLYVLFENHNLMIDNLPQKVLATPADLRPDLTALVRELHQPGENTYDLVEALVVRLLIGLQRAQQGQIQSPKDTPQNRLIQPAVVDQIEAFMQRNLQRPLSRADLAKVANISPSHLARIFRQATGRTLTERLIELRITSAKQLLLESTLPVSEISYQVGYSSFSHFARLFHQKVGVTPTEYRQSQGMVWRKMDI